MYVYNKMNKRTDEDLPPIEEYLLQGGRVLKKKVSKKISNKKRKSSRKRRKVMRKYRSLSPLDKYLIKSTK